MHKKNRTGTERMPKLLELCSGSGIVSRYFREQGWETTTVDVDWRCRPDLRMDVRDIELSRWEPGEFDVVWASLIACPAKLHYHRCTPVSG